MTNSLQEFPIVRDITLKRWGDWHRTYRLRENDKVTPRDTTGYTVLMEIKSATNGEVYDTLTIANGKVVHTPANGQFNFNLTKAQISDYKFSSAYYELSYTDGSGNIVPLGTGSVRVI